MRNEKGFALLVVLFAMLVMSILATAAISGASDSQKGSYAMRESASAFYNAEAGIDRLTAEWTNLRSATSITLDSLETGEAKVFSGSYPYTITVRRVDDASTETELFYVTSEGRAMTGVGTREVAVLFEIPFVEFDIVAAITTSGATKVGGSATINGLFRAPRSARACVLLISHIAFFNHIIGYKVCGYIIIPELDGGIIISSV